MVPQELDTGHIPYTSSLVSAGGSVWWTRPRFLSVTRVHLGAP